MKHDKNKLTVLESGPLLSDGIVRETYLTDPEINDPQLLRGCFHAGAYPVTVDGTVKSGHADKSDLILCRT